MDEQEYLSEQAKEPTYPAAEIYAMLCVPDITRKEWVAIVDLITKDAARYPAADFTWISRKTVEVGAALERATVVNMCVKQLDALKERAKKAKKELPPADEGYTDYQQSK